MEKILFPVDFLDSQEVFDLTPEAKLLLAATTLHPLVSPCGVLRVTEFVAAGLSIPFSSARGICESLEEAGLCTFSRGTGALFRKKHFHIHTPGKEGTTWRRAITTAVGKVSDEGLRAVVAEAIATAPPTKEAAVLLPSNLLTSLPQRGGGTRWVASELLILLGVAAHPFQTDAGILSIDLEVFSKLVSLPIDVVHRCLREFDRLRALVFDQDSCEVFCSGRMSTKSRDVKRIAETIKTANSRRVKLAAKRVFEKTFGDFSNKTNCYSLGEVRGGELDVDVKIEPELNFYAFLDFLRAEGARSRAPNLEWDRQRLERLREAGDWLGHDVALAAISKCRFVSEAEKAFKAAGLFLQAAELKKLSTPLKPEVNKARKDSEKQSTGEDFSHLVGCVVQANDGQKFLIGRLGFKVAGKITPLKAIAAALNDGSFVLVA